MKKLFSLVLALLLCCALSVSAFADVWIPPTDDGGYCEALVQLAFNKEEAEAFNRFAGEYLSAGLEGFDKSTTDEEVAAAVVRMILQHPERYEGVISSYDSSGVVGISAEAFAACAEEKFGRTLRAEDYYTLREHRFLVTASDTGSGETPHRFVSASAGFYNGDRTYHFMFELYETTADPETCYALEDPLDAENAEFVGYFYLDLYYSGDIEATTIQTSDLTVTGFDMFTFVTPDWTELAETQETAEAETDVRVETEAVAAPLSENSNDSGFWKTETIIVTAVVTAAALGAVVAILLIWKKKR